MPFWLAYLMRYVAYLYGTVVITVLVASDMELSPLGVFFCMSGIFVILLALDYAALSRD